MRKLIAFDDETYQALTQLSRNRMGTLQELADEAFRDLLAKHNVPVDLKDALRRSVKDTNQMPGQGGRNLTAIKPHVAESIEKTTKPRSSGTAHSKRTRAKV